MLPEEMVERLDRYDDAPGQVDEICRHYSRISRAREDTRILELEKRAMGDARANEEFNALLKARADRNDSTLEEELAKVKRRRG